MQQDVPVDLALIDEIRAYERRVLAPREAGA